MGFSFGELVVLAIVALIVIGPKDLPKMLRSAGRLIGGLKRAVADVRRETGLDEVLRGDFQDLERLADHIERMDETKDEPEQLPLPNLEDEAMRREREYPKLGADSRDLLPEDTSVYVDAPVYANADDERRNAPPEGTVAADAPEGASPEPEEARA